MNASIFVLRTIGLSFDAPDAYMQVGEIDKAVEQKLSEEVTGPQGWHAKIFAQEHVIAMFQAKLGTNDRLYEGLERKLRWNVERKLVQLHNGIHENQMKPLDYVSELCELKAKLEATEHAMETLRSKLTQKVLLTILALRLSNSFRNIPKFMNQTQAHLTGLAQSGPPCAYRLDWTDGFVRLMAGYIYSKG